MTKRERILTALVAGLVLAGGLMAGGWLFTNSLAKKNTKIVEFEGEINKNKLVAARGLRASDTLRDYAAMSLPANPSQAKHIYRRWLSRQLNALNFDGISLDSEQSRLVGEAYQIHRFSARAQGDLKQVTELFHRIKTANILHRIRSFQLTPVKDSRDLELRISTEVVAMEGGPTDDLPVNDSSADVAELNRYKRFIVDRNVFGPENHAPSLDAPRTIEVALNSRLDLRAEASDPDEYDSVVMEANLDNLEGAEFDKDTGRVNWSPDEEGEHTIQITARDDGFPNMETTREVRIVAYKPKPPAPAPVPEDPPAPGLEEARFAEVTAITGSGGRRQIWVNIKSEGRTLRVGVGDSFRIGEVEATVVSINSRGAEVSSAEKLYNVSLGERLTDARVISNAN